jgi:nucleotide-binding universal stress UspA family protein
MWEPTSSTCCGAARCPCCGPSTWSSTRWTAGPSPGSTPGSGNATDWSPSSAKALAAVGALKGAARSAIVAHVIDEKLTKGRTPSAVADIEAETRRRLEGYCRELQDSGLAAEPRLAFGKSVPEVIRLSREHRATMIVLGKTGKDWFQQYFLGGVSHRIAEASELPVMVVP